MPDQPVCPVLHPIDARITLPGSKSITNRALLLAALSQGRSKLYGVLFSEDSEALIQALIELGFDLNIDKVHCTVEIEGKGGSFPNPYANLYCRDAGTVTRFLIPACAAIGGYYGFSASFRMSERPLAPLLKALEQQAVEFDFDGKSYHMPFTLQSKGLKGGEIFVDIQESSQFLSGLLMAAPYAKKPVILTSKQALAQKSYVHMTLGMMQDFGISPRFIDARTLAVPKGIYQARDYTIEPDASTASYFFAMAVLTNGTIHISNLTRHSMQGDIQFLALLEKMGCKVIEEQNGITVMGCKELKGLGNIDMTGFSDTFMTLAALAVFADSPTTIHGLAHTRLQESDRIAVISEGLERLGIQVSSTQDSLTIYPGKPYGTKVCSYQDHRIAMSLALIGLKAPGMVIEGAECVAKTCPDYFKLMKQVSGS